MKILLVRTRKQLPSTTQQQMMRYHTHQVIYVYKRKLFTKMDPQRNADMKHRKTHQQMQKNVNLISQTNNVSPLTQKTSPFQRILLTETKPRKKKLISLQMHRKEKIKTISSNNQTR